MHIWCALFICTTKCAPYASIRSILLPSQNVSSNLITYSASACLHACNDKIIRFSKKAKTSCDSKRFG